MVFKQLKPSKFNKFEIYKDNLEGKIILYTDRPPGDSQIEFNGSKYNLGPKQAINLPGVVSNPSNSLYKITTMYEKNIFFSSLSKNGALFLYTGFKPSLSGRTASPTATKQLLFNCYSLEEV